RSGGRRFDSRYAELYSALWRYDIGSALLAMLAPRPHRRSLAAAHADPDQASAARRWHKGKSFDRRSDRRASRGLPSRRRLAGKSLQGPSGHAPRGLVPSAGRVSGGQAGEGKSKGLTACGAGGWTEARFLMDTIILRFL